MLRGGPGRAEEGLTPPSAIPEGFTGHWDGFLGRFLGPSGLPGAVAHCYVYAVNPNPIAVHG